MPVINGVYLKDFTALPSSVTDANIIPIAITGDQVAYRTTVAGIVTDARITSKLLTGLSVTGATILATDTILQAFGKVQNQLNGKVSSVGLTMPAAFNVANSPITSAGTLAVTAAGVASQYIRGDGALADFPTTGGGGSSVSYYLNGSVSQGTFVGNTYYEMNKTPVIGTGTDFTIGANGYIAQFITDANDPASLLIPAGNWNVEMYFSASSNGGSPSFYVEVYKYDGTTFTLLGSSSATPEGITNGTAIDIYYTSVGIPETVLTLTDRLAIRVYVTHSGRTITLHTEDNHLSEIVTTFSNGLTTLNGLTKQAQYFAVGSTGTDFAIVSSVDTHTFNLPTASASNRGALSSADWTTFNNKAAALSGTINTIAYWDSSTTIASLALATYPSLTELSYVKGVTTAIQTQLNAKQATITLTTTGSSGAATFIANTLNIPNYAPDLSGYLPLAGGIMTGQIVLKEGTTSTDYTKGLRFPNDPYGGSGDTSGLRLYSSLGESMVLELYIGNDGGDDIINFATGVGGTANNDSVKINGNKIWNAGNLPTPQSTITLTTTGTSGAATLVSNTLNIPNYADSFVGTVTSVAAITLGTTGTDLSSTVANGTTTPVITLQVPTASAANRGALSSADWSTFNGKQGTITLTTTGTSGAATFSANTLNIPNYADGGVLSLSAIGGTANANAATITGTVLNLQPASASFGGVITTGAQTFAGDKTLTGTLYGIGLSMTGTTADIVQGTATSGKALRGTATTGWGLYASATTGVGVEGNSSGTGGTGVFGSSVNGYGGVFYNDSTTYAALEVNNNNESPGDVAIFRQGGSSIFTVASVNSTLNTTLTANSFIPSSSTVPTNGMYLSAANTLNFSTNTTSRLSIASTGEATFSSTVTAVGYSKFWDATQGLYIGAFSGGSGFGALYPVSVTPSSTNHAFAASSGATILNTGSSGVIDLEINTTSALYINNSRNVGIGTTSPTAKLYVLGSSTTESVYYAEKSTASFTGNIITSLCYTASGTGWNHFIGYSDIGSTTNIKIIGNGNIQNANNSYGALSDIKLKENITDATPKLNDLLKVKVRNFNLKSSDVKQIGVIAQELEQIFPSMIEETEDFGQVEIIDEQGNITQENQSLGTFTKAVKYSVFVPMLIKAIQELKAEIDLLKGEPIIPTDNNLE